MFEDEQQHVFRYQSPGFTLELVDVQVLDAMGGVIAEGLGFGVDTLNDGTSFMAQITTVGILTEQVATFRSTLRSSSGLSAGPIEAAAPFLALEAAGQTCPAPLSVDTCANGLLCDGTLGGPLEGQCIAAPGTPPVLNSVTSVGFPSAAQGECGGDLAATGAKILLQGTNPSYGVNGVWLVSGDEFQFPINIDATPDFAVTLVLCYGGGPYDATWRVSDTVGFFSNEVVFQLPVAGSAP
jgi:hypothetical protein